MKKYLLHSLLLILCLCCLTLTGCSGNGTTQVSETTAPQDENARFDDYTNELFKASVSSDALTLHYTLKDPSAYGITLSDDAMNLGRITPATYDEDVAELQTEADSLHAFDYDKLSEDRQLTYDILDLYYQTELEYSDKDLMYYGELLNSSTGVQSQLPVLMAEYHFYDKEDVDTYLLLLADVPAYFANILAYEQNKSDAGLFMSDTQADGVIESCHSFASNTEDNLLITVFNSKIDGMTELTDEERAAYKQTNQDTVLNSVIPSYNALADGIEGLKGTGTNDLGICGFEHGKEYYEYLIKSNTGSSRTPDELIKLLDKTMKNDMMAMGAALSADASIYNEIDHVKYPYTEPKEILDHLQTAILNNFPEPAVTDYDIKYVDKTLEDSLSPAFYLTPTLDDTSSNVIYINGAYLDDSGDSLFATLCHEGYPGHLYQVSYFYNTNPAPVRSALNFDGYTEGWATYVEYMSFKWADLDSSALATCLSYNQELTLCLHARADLGVNYEGWTVADTQSFLTDWGISDIESAQSVYDLVREDPGNYLSYCVGALEFQALRDEAKKDLKSAFDAKAFHTFILDMGPCQFDILEKYMQTWMKEQ